MDVVIAGSQKALMTPPGLAFASVNQRAMALAAETPGRRYYFDWAKTAKGQAEQPPNSPFTPAVTLWRALDVALRLIEEEGLDRVLERHAILARAARNRGARPGALRPGQPGCERPHRRAPPGFDRRRSGAEADARPIRSDGGWGAGQLKGKIVRIAHCGYYGAFDIVIALTALESSLRDLGAEVEPGAGAGAAQRVFAEAGRAPEPVA